MSKNTKVKPDSNKLAAAINKALSKNVIGNTVPPAAEPVATVAAAPTPTSPDYRDVIADVLRDADANDKLLADARHRAYAEYAIQQLLGTVIGVSVVLSCGGGWWAAFGAFGAIWAFNVLDTFVLGISRLLANYLPKFIAHPLGSSGYQVEAWVHKNAFCLKGEPI